MSIVSVSNVNKRIEDFQLQDISFELPKGYIMGIIGQNGAGKTTLLNLLLHLYFPTTGQIRIDDMTYGENETQIKDEIGYVLNENVFSGELTLLQNAELYGKYYSHYSSELFIQYCESFSLMQDSKLKNCSKGEKLKFQFAFALSHRPKLLILDEPTANFDPEFREQFLHQITQFVSDGERSVILATHLTKDLDQIADYILFLQDGRQLCFQEKEDLLDNFRIVGGETYKIKLLPKEKIVYHEIGELGSKAFVRHSRWNRYDKELDVRRPTIEEIMYYIVKATDFHHKMNVFEEK